MTKYSCDSCNSNLFLDNSVGRTYDSSKHYLLCKTCIENSKICSKSKCKNTFLLSETELNGLKNIFISNQKNNKKFYLYHDVKNKILSKYGNFENLKKIVEDRTQKINLQRQKKRSIMDKRRKKLIEVLEANKLEFKNHGDCYMYIHYGEPSIDTVVHNELAKIHDKRERRLELAKALSRVNIKLDETLESCYNYINNVGYKNLDETVRAAEVEYFFKYETDYLDIIKNERYSKNIFLAKDIALKRYLEKNKKDSLPTNIYNTTTLNKVDTIVRFD